MREGVRSLFLVIITIKITIKNIAYNKPQMSKLKKRFRTDNFYSKILEDNTFERPVRFVCCWGN